MIFNNHWERRIKLP